MIQFNAAPAFDFDEWTALYQRDPAQFEARRKALLTIEVARSGRHSAKARELVAQLEQHLEGKNDSERIQISMLAMLSAAKQLAQELESLSRLIDPQNRISRIHPRRSS